MHTKLNWSKLRWKTETVMAIAELAQARKPGSFALQLQHGMAEKFHSNPARPRWRQKEHMKIFRTKYLSFRKDFYYLCHFNETFCPVIYVKNKLIRFHVTVNMGSK